MLNYNEIRERKYIVLDGGPYEVLESQVARKQKQKPVNQTKLRNLLTGGVKQHTFHASDTAEEADIEKNRVTYSFKKSNRQSGGFEYWFIEGDDRSKRFSIDGELIGDKINFMKEGEKINALFFNGEVLGIELPIKVELKVVEAPPAVKGNTSSGATKKIKLETGLSVIAPLFIKEGDIVRVKTETGEYTERV